MTAKYNVVVAGKTGVGKSMLINYLYGDTVVKTGTGRPVTQRGFHHIDKEINGLPVRLFDSWGLEVGKDKEWLGLLNEELEKRGTDRPAEEWFHSVFYCIGSGGHRIEDFDVTIIKKFLDSKYKVSVLLTKADLINEKQEEELTSAIHEGVGPVPVIPVCSEEKVLRGGLKTECFGKEEVELQAYNDFWESIVLRLPSRCIAALEQRIDAWQRYIGVYIEKNTGRWNWEDIFENTKKEISILKVEEFEKQNTINKEIRRTFDIYSNVARELKYPPFKYVSTSKIQASEEVEFAAWEWLWVVPVGIVAGIPMGIWHLIMGARENKDDLHERVKEFIQQLKGEFPKIEDQISVALREAQKKAASLLK
jgi:GTP-binding protein EngB required for normal cell division